MKTKILLTGVLIFSLSLSLTSCGGGDSKTVNAPAPRVQEQYQCPMKCNDAKYDKAGKCPVCGMDLEKITNS